ncbi:hypothetical protein [Mesorhizobium sp. LNJC384A00]|uniref:hypothetical protein n=1 Tax=Mesorhizobium sp. LNJC384A00 TaxID=1287268 RepID=UPI000416ACC7|nr:hypothetical protein [Mesorhizobium sp. LNJC384A00]
MPYTYSCQRIGQIVRQISRKAGITKRVYPYLLHYTMAPKLWWLVMDITDVQRSLATRISRRGGITPEPRPRPCAGNSIRSPGPSHLRA